MENIDEVFIREMQASDIEKLLITFCFPWSSVQQTTEKWKRYGIEHQKNVRTVYLIEKQIIGYASLLYASEYPAFRNASIPEINDVWISEEWRNRGLGKMLILHLENQARAADYKQIGLGVGLYKDYGPAQKLYFRLGYVPDGHGITYKCQSVIPGEKHPVDDDLILWLLKSL